MGSHAAFFYGTLMAPPVLYRVCHGSPDPAPWQKDMLNIRAAVLHGYTRHCVKGQDYPGIIPVARPGSGEVGSTTTSISGISNDNVPTPASSSSKDDPASSTKSAAAALNDQTLSSGPLVQGTLVTGLTDGDMYRLDIFEGDQYKKREVTVYPIRRLSGDNDVHSGEQSVEVEDEPIKALTYVWTDDRHLLSEREWSLNEFLRDKLRDWVGVDRPDYLSVDEAVEQLDRRAGEDTHPYKTNAIARSGGNSNNNQNKVDSDKTLVVQQRDENGSSEAGAFPREYSFQVSIKPGAGFSPHSKGSFSVVCNVSF